ncbi:CHASE2 domain-containing sensor protein [Rhizobium leguminosarum]|nr:CHASE2 domain-containing sensor protein [Rhizobium leguminosarum]
MTRVQHIGVVIGLAIVALLTILRADDPGIFKLIRGVTFDEYQRLVPRTFEPMPVRVIDIDEASLREFGQWPWPRDRMALLVDRLSAMGASAIAFDILFAEPDRLSPRNVVSEVAGVDPSLAEKLPDNDEIFARSIAEKPVVLGFGLSNEGHYRPPVKAGFAFTGESPVSAPPYLGASTPLRPQLEANAAGLGHISLNPGNPSPVVRAVPLFLTDGEQLYPNLAIEALRVAQGASTYVLSGAPDRTGIMTSAKIGEFVVPLTAAGELWLYVSPDRAERYISARPKGFLPRSRLPLTAASSSSAHRQPGCRTSALRRSARTFLAFRCMRRPWSRFSPAISCRGPTGRTGWKSWSSRCSDACSSS